MHLRHLKIDAVILSQLKYVISLGRPTWIKSNRTKHKLQSLAVILQCSRSLNGMTSIAACKKCWKICNEYQLNHFSNSNNIEISLWIFLSPSTSLAVSRRRSEQIIGMRVIIHIFMNAYAWYYDGFFLLYAVAVNNIVLTHAHHFMH